MHISFIIFVIIAITIVAISAYCLGKRVSMASLRESPNAQNNTPYEECSVKNAEVFKYETFTDSRDGETYRSVQIGNQIWMVDNLRFKAKGSFAPDNDEANVKTFGRLYTWTTAIK